MFSLSGFKLFRFLVDMLPAVLNNRSEAELDAQIDKYFLANRDKMGKEAKFFFHHSSGLLSGSCLGVAM